MSILNTIENWLPEVEKAATVGESVAVLVAKIAIDITALKNNPAALSNLITDLENGIPDIIKAVKANTTTSN